MITASFERVVLVSLVPLSLALIGQKLFGLLDALLAPVVELLKFVH